ncbi:MAG: glutamine-hydrolyzing GMP synthase, partial [Fimbriimonadaceae bacterium]
MLHQTVLVVDFGGQYTQLIVRRVRELGVYSEMVPWTSAEEKIRSVRPAAVILSGGPRSVLEEGAPTIDPEVLAGIPVLGICYGLQLLAHRMGGRVAKAGDKEYGRRELTVRAADGLVGALASHSVWMSHGDQVVEAPPRARITASTESCPVAAFEDDERRVYGVQFHPEVTHTPGGTELLRAFLLD